MVKGDLTVKKVFESLDTIQGIWISDRKNISESGFECRSTCHKINFEKMDELRALGFDDIEVIGDTDGDFNFKFIWKKEKK